MPVLRLSLKVTLENRLSTEIAMVGSRNASMAMACKTAKVLLSQRVCPKRFNCRLVA